jgi:hypothetical protein
MTATNNEAAKAAAGPRYALDIEGTIYDWDQATITVPQIRQLGGLPADQPVLMIDLKTNVERTLTDDEVIDVTPGLGFSKKVEFRRG